MGPSVSILIPCYNAENWVDSALRSAIGQEWGNLQVIAIDDGSTDRTPGILDRWQPEVKVIHRLNLGSNATRNELLDLASGEWIQYLDADDYLLPQKISKQMAVNETHPSADVIYSPQIIESHIGDRIFKNVWNPHDSEGFHDPWSYHLEWNLCQTGGALFRRSSLIQAGGWNSAQKCCQDNELYFRLLKNGAEFEYCGDAGSVYRRFSTGTISTSESNQVKEEILKLLHEGERYLDSQGLLTDRRLTAVNNMRFRIARETWLNDTKAAQDIIDIIKKSDSAFVPSSGLKFQSLYRFLFKFFGFNTAEGVAGIKRRIRG